MVQKRDTIAMGYSYLLHRHPRSGVYRFRRAVPDELRDIIGKREIKVSLRTTDFATAKRRAATESIKADRIIEDARKRPAEFLSQQQARDANAMVQETVTDLLKYPRSDE